MLEYRIVQQIGKGKPFCVDVFNDFNSCYDCLINHIEYRKTCVNNKYYVLNDFFENEYELIFDNMHKFVIEVREVQNWNTYSKFKNTKNNLYFFTKTIV